MSEHKRLLGKSVLDAARNGQGVALAPEIVVSGEIREGQLVPLTGSRVRLGCYNLYIRKEKGNDRTLAKCREWVVAEFASFESSPVANPTPRMIHSDIASIPEAGSFTIGHSLRVRRRIAAGEAGSSDGSCATGHDNDGVRAR